MERNDLRSLRVILLFSILVLLSLLLHWGTERLIPQSQPDSDSYLSYDWASFDTVFRGIRTPGYPLFLKIVTVPFGVVSIPFAHWAAMVAAVAVWYRGLRRIGFHTFSALCASGPLLFSAATWDLGKSIASDSLGIVLCIASCGYFFSALSHTARWWHWILLGAATIAAVLVRPAYLFLLPLWPILVASITFFVMRNPHRSSVQKALCAGLASVVPFLGYCSMRAGLVGEFGLVSFEGYNLIGITGQFITPEDLVELEGPELELAKGMIRNRDHVVDYSPPDSYPTMVRLYNATVWTTAAPAAEEVFGNDVEASNAALKSLALESLNFHRREYASWVLNNGKSMVEQLLRGALVDCGSRLALVGLALVLAVHALIPQTIDRLFMPIAADSESSSLSLSLEWRLLWWICVAIIGAKGLLVILVEPALGRYVAAVGCLIPALVGWCCGHLVRTVVMWNRFMWNRRAES